MKTILEKLYGGESIVDVERDVYEALNDSDVPVDEYGFQKGVFNVNITWDAEPTTHVPKSMEQLLAENALLIEKVTTYERVLHKIQLHANVTMNAKVVHQLIANICNWSYAHRAGNGELSEEEQNEYIKSMFDKLLVVKYDI